MPFHPDTRGCEEPQWKWNSYNRLGESMTWNSSLTDDRVECDETWVM